VYLIGDKIKVLGKVSIYQCFKNQKSILTTQSDNILLVGAWVQGRYIPPLFAKAGSDFLGTAQDIQNSAKRQKRFLEFTVIVNHLFTNRD
jgi:hypothetical protein